MTAKELETRVLALLHVWDKWSIYPPLYLGGLESTLMRKPEDEEEAAEGIQRSDFYGKSGELDVLRKRATAAGLSTKGLSAERILRRLQHLHKFVERKSNP